MHTLKTRSNCTSIQPDDRVQHLQSLSTTRSHAIKRLQLKYAVSGHQNALEGTSACQHKPPMEDTFSAKCLADRLPNFPDAPNKCQIQAVVKLMTPFIPHEPNLLQQQQLANGCKPLQNILPRIAKTNPMPAPAATNPNNEVPP